MTGPAIFWVRSREAFGEDWVLDNKLIHKDCNLCIK